MNAPRHSALGRHLPALDGLRGIAVLLVMFHHFTSSLTATDRLSSGLLHLGQYGLRGVDVFFVLSGFLITGILIDSREGEGYFRNFYMRRVLRIFPLYYAAIAVLLGLVTLLYAPGDPERTAIVDNQRWLWTYGANLFLSLQGSWDLGMANHFWSLAVEEHFYLMWPVLVWLTSTRRLLWLCLGVFFLAFVSRGLVTAVHAPEIARYVLTPCRIDGLALGALCAVLLRVDADALLLRILRSLWVPAMLSLILTKLAPSVAGLIDASSHISLVVSLLSAAVVLQVATHARSLPTRVLELRPLRFFGRYSYGLYVIHLPLQVVLTKTGVLSHASLGASWARSLAVLTLLTAASVLAAFVSFHLFEKHFLKLKRFYEYNAPRPVPTAEVQPLA